MAPCATASGASSPVIQFLFPLDGKIFSFSGVLGALVAGDVTILAVSFFENFGNTTVRCVVNYPDEARKVFSEQGISYQENEILAVEISSAMDMPKVAKAIFAAEIKIHHMYAFLARPQGKIALAIQTENNEFAADVMNRSGVKILSQGDIGR
ncbi:MAG: hypothetical protein LBI61_02135 [Puniceicoccales bacterium]|jgi:hypothetical protein|nr:hypothetical protein [Puniceicoccales bacterium]